MSAKSLSFEALQKGSECNPMAYARGARFCRETLGVSGYQPPHELTLGCVRTPSATVIEILSGNSGGLDFTLLVEVKDAKTIEAEIARLQAKLAAIKSKPAWVRVVLNKLPLVPAETADLLSKLAERKFGKGRFAIEAAGDMVIVQGDAQVIEWAIALANKLNEK